MQYTVQFETGNADQTCWTLVVGPREFTSGAPADAVAYDILAEVNERHLHGNWRVRVWHGPNANPLTADLAHVLDSQTWRDRGGRPARPLGGRAPTPNRTTTRSRPGPAPDPHTRRCRGEDWNPSTRHRAISDTEARQPHEHPNHPRTTPSRTVLTEVFHASIGELPAGDGAITFYDLIVRLPELHLPEPAGETRTSPLRAAIATGVPSRLADHRGRRHHPPVRPAPPPADRPGPDPHHRPGVQQVRTAHGRSVEANALDAAAGQLRDGTYWIRDTMAPRVPHPRRPVRPVRRLAETLAQAAATAARAGVAQGSYLTRQAFLDAVTEHFGRIVAGPR
jgi:hypothetical protein